MDFRADRARRWEWCSRLNRRGCFDDTLAGDFADGTLAIFGRKIDFIVPGSRKIGSGKNQKEDDTKEVGQRQKGPAVPAPACNPFKT
jgi:hypothetical protein